MNTPKGLKWIDARIERFRRILQFIKDSGLAHVKVGDIHKGTGITDSAIRETLNKSSDFFTVVSRTKKGCNKSALYIVPEITLEDLPGVRKMFIQELDAYRERHAKRQRDMRLEKGGFIPEKDNSYRYDFENHYHSEEWKDLPYCGFGKDLADTLAKTPKAYRRNYEPRSMPSLALLANGEAVNENMEIAFSE